LDFSRLRTGEIVAAIGGIALFVFLFFDWFEAGGFEGASLDGWEGLGGDFSGFIVALTSVSGVALALLAMAGQRVNIPLPRGAVTATLGTLSVLIILWRFLANPGDLEIGIFLGLLAAGAIAVGAWMALREDGFEPLLTVAGERTTTTTAAASAPAATPSPRPVTAPSGGSGSSGSGSGGSTATKSRSSGSKAAKSRSSGGKSAGKKSTAKGTAKKSSAKKGATKTGSRSKSSGSSRAKSTGSSKPKSKPKAKPKSGGKRRSSGKRK
jgi:hypothetical protein